MVAFLIGTGIGVLLGQLALVFFQDEIFDWMDRVVNRVRKFFGLKPIW